MRRKSIAGLIAIIIIASVVIFSGCLQQQDGGEEQYAKFEENVFSFEIPESWEKMTGSELEQFRQQFEEQSRQLVRQYPYARPEDFKGVLYFAGFSAPRHEALLVAAVIQIPPQAEDYLGQMYESSKEKIQWGIDQGKARKALSNRKTEINGIPVLEVDMEMADGSRMITYNFYSSDYPDQGIGLVMLYKPGRFSAYQSDFNHVISTLRIHLQ